MPGKILLSHIISSWCSSRKRHLSKPQVQEQVAKGSEIWWSLGHAGGDSCSRPKNPVCSLKPLLNILYTTHSLEIATPSTVRYKWKPRNKWIHSHTLSIKIMMFEQKKLYFQTQDPSRINTQFWGIFSCPSISRKRESISRGKLEEHTALAGATVGRYKPYIAK